MFPLITVREQFEFTILLMDVRHGGRRLHQVVMVVLVFRAAAHVNNIRVGNALALGR